MVDCKAICIYLEIAASCSCTHVYHVSCRQKQLVSRKNPHEPVCFTPTWGLWGLQTSLKKPSQWWLMKSPFLVDICWYIPPSLIPLKTLRTHRFLNTPASACASPTNSITYVIHLQPPVLSDVQSPAHFSETSAKKMILKSEKEAISKYRYFGIVTPIAGLEIMKYPPWYPAFSHFYLIISQFDLGQKMDPGRWWYLYALRRPRPSLWQAGSPAEEGRKSNSWMGREVTKIGGIVKKMETIRNWRGGKNDEKWRKLMKNDGELMERKGKILGNDENDGELMEKKKRWELIGKWWKMLVLCGYTSMQMQENYCFSHGMWPHLSLGPLIPSWLEQAPFPTIHWATWKTWKWKFHFKMEVRPAGTLMALDGPWYWWVEKTQLERHRGTGHPPWKTRAMKHCQVFCAEKLWLPQFGTPTASTFSGRKMETTSLLSSQLPPFTSQRKIWKILLPTDSPNQPGFLIHVGKTMS